VLISKFPHLRERENDPKARRAVVRIAVSISLEEGAKTYNIVRVGAFFKAN
jgi:hypothetical protein